MSDIKNSLMSFDGASDVINNLINKIANVVGWFANRDTPKKEAYEVFTSDIKEMEIPSYAKAVLIRNANKLIKEYEREYGIVNIAEQYLNPDAEPDKIENDWVAQFMDKAKNISDKDFQLIWGKILAGEANNPGSFSIRTLDKLENMDKNDAECFIRAIAVSVINGHSVLIPDINHETDLIDFEDITLLDECGLLSSTLIQIEIKFEAGGEKTIYYNDNFVLMIRNRKSENNSLVVTGFKFTSSGKELRELIKSNISDKMLLSSAKEISLNRSDLDVNVYRIKEINGDRITYDNSPYKF